MRSAKWSDDQIAKLKSLAGKVPARDIAAELGRTQGALEVQASKLKIPLRCTRNGRRVATKKLSHAVPTNP
jgi:hypothetical protein